MSAKGARKVRQAGTPGRGRILAERRRSNAAGLHIKRTDRGTARRQAIAADRNC